MTADEALEYADALTRTEASSMPASAPRIARAALALAVEVRRLRDLAVTADEAWSAAMERAEEAIRGQMHSMADDKWNDALDTALEALRDVRDQEPTP